MRVAATGVLWGTGGLAGTLLAHSAAISPLAVGCYRLLVGGLALVALLAATGRLRGVRRDGAALRQIIAIGLLAGLYQSCYFASIALSSVSLATLVTMGSSPVLVVAANSVLTRRRPNATLVGAVVLALIGLSLLVGSPGSSQAPLAGALLALSAAASIAGITLIGRRQLARLDPVSTTACGFTLGGLVLAVPAAQAGLSFELTATPLALVVYLGIVPTALAYVLYFGGLRTVRPGPAVLLTLLEPLTATALGALLLGERLGLLGTIGALLVATAALVSQRRGCR